MQQDEVQKWVTTNVVALTSTRDALCALFGLGPAAAERVGKQTSRRPPVARSSHARDEEDERDRENLPKVRVDTLSHSTPSSTHTLSPTHTVHAAASRTVLTVTVRYGLCHRNHNMWCLTSKQRRKRSRMR